MVIKIIFTFKEQAFLPAGPLARKWGAEDKNAAGFISGRLPTLLFVLVNQ
jgi:hypothetical protein